MWEKGVRLRGLFPHPQTKAAQINRQALIQRIRGLDGLDHPAFFSGRGAAQQRNRTALAACPIHLPAQRSVRLGNLDDCRASSQTSAGCIAPVPPCSRSSPGQARRNHLHKGHHGTLRRRAQFTRTRSTAPALLQSWITCSCTAMRGMRLPRKTSTSRRSSSHQMLFET